jgi:cytochrome c biogenesis protein CcmG/thiol:disulfide interchange protein DsbE
LAGHPGKAEIDLMNRLMVVAVLVAVIAMFGYALTREPTLASPLVGRSAPAFEVPLFGTDANVALADLAGRPVVLNFWASWCLACRDEAAVLEAGWREHGPEVAFVGIAVNDEEDAARSFIERYGKTYLLGPDAAGSVAIDYGLFGVPETFFIAPDGRILAKHIGPLTVSDLDRGIGDLQKGTVGRATGDPALLTPLEEGSR